MRTILTLFHFGSAISAQKVRLALAEKRISFESRDVKGILRSSDYLNINPNGVVPTLVHDTHVLIESRIISEYLEEAFPEPPLMPCGPYERYRARYWSRQSDGILHLSVLTLGFVCYMRDMLVAMPQEQRMEFLPGLNDPIIRQRSLELLRGGHDSPLVPEALRCVSKVLGEMDIALADSGPWLAGSQYSLADTDLTPYLHRLEALGLSSLWMKHAAVTDWFERVRARLSYRSAIMDWITPDETRADSYVRARSRCLLERASLETHSQSEDT